MRPAHRARLRRLVALVCLASLAAPALAACGLPDQSRTEVVDDRSVPYDLLAPGRPTSGEDATEPTAPDAAPVVFWVRPDDLLAAAPTDLSCAQAPADAVAEVLDTLAASPSTSGRDAGLASAIPSTATLALVRVEDGVAEVELDPLAIGDAERLPLAAAQIVLSVTSVSGVDAVRLVTSGEAVDLPLPGGALVTGAATAEDYAVLLADRPARSGTDPVGIGCREPGT